MIVPYVLICQLQIPGLCCSPIYPPLPAQKFNIRIIVLGSKVPEPRQELILVCNTEKK